MLQLILACLYLQNLGQHSHIPVFTCPGVRDAIFILKERVTLTKLISVVSTIVGVCLISFYHFNILDEKENASNGTMSQVSEKNSDDDVEEYEYFLGYVVSFQFYHILMLLPFSFCSMW